MANPFAKYVQPEERENPFAKYAQPEPVKDAVENPFAKFVAPTPAAPTPTAPAEESAEKSTLPEFPKALVRGAYDLKGMYAGLQQRSAALGMETPQAAMDVFNKIDAGEVKNKADISKLIGGERRLPTAEEMVQGDSRLGAKVRTFNLANDYLAATPEERKTLRAQMQGDIQQGSKDLAAATALGEQVKKEAAPYEARVKSLFDIESFADAMSYLGSTSGQAIPQMVPMVGASVLTKGRAGAPAAIGAGMELGAGTQNRVDFISDKIKDETDPDKRIAKVGKYIQDTSDVTVTAAIMNGALDAILGPEKDIAKAIAAKSLKDMTRKEIAKQIPKAVAKSGAAEFFTGGMQEVVQINAERTLGEQTGDAFTKDNIKRVVDSAMAEAIGGATVTTGFEAGRVAAAKPTKATQTEEDRLLADLDAQADREEAAGEEGIDDFIAQQRAGVGAESRADVAGVSGVGAAEAAGVSDTGVPTAPREGGLAGVGATTTVAPEGTRAEPSALEEYYPDMGEAVQPGSLADLEAKANAAYDARVQADQLQDDLLAEAEASEKEFKAAQDKFNSLTEDSPEEEQIAANQVYQEARQKYDATIARYNEARLAAKDASDTAFELDRKVENQRKGAAPNIKPTFALPENYVHGTDYLTAQKIIQQGRLIPDAGKRMYSYSQFGRKAVYLTDRNGWWLDADKAADGRAAVYDASVPFKIDPDADIREVNTQAELDAIAREIGEPDGNAMMRKLSVENLDYEQAAREVKNLSFEEFVKREVKRRREQLQKYEVPDADTVVDIPSWAALDAIERPGFASSEEDILDSLRDQYDFLQNYEEEYKDADEVTKKLLDAGIDGIYIGPNFGSVDPEEDEAFSAILDRVRQEMPDASPPDSYDAAVEEYKKVNPTYFERAGNPVASDQLALFRPELAVVDRARLAAARPSKPAFAPDAYTRRPGETVEQYTERLAAQPTSKLAPEILELLQNNDLNGALRELAAKFSAGPQIRTFYGELATRIADLNLPTEVRIGDQRNLTRRSIDAFTRPEQIRLFSYIRTKFPAYFDQYFRDYDKTDALETVYLGLLELQQFNLKSVLGPVQSEYATVLKAFEGSMPGISANGAYYPAFDVLTLNDSVGRSNGLDYYTLMHEAVHAATETLLNTPSDQRTNEQNEAISELRTLYLLANDTSNFDYYGLTNLSEFIAEAFTNKKFQDFLKGIPYAPARTNIFKRFIQAVLNLVGIDNVAARTMVEAEKLFSAARPFQVLSAGPRFAGAKKPRVRGPISKPDTWRTQEQVATSLTDLFNDALKGRRSWDEVLKTVGPAMWDTSTGAFRSALLGMANLRQIGDLTATKFPQIQGAIRMIEKMLAYRGKKLNQASEIVKAWTTAQAKNPKQSELVGRVMLEATIRGQNPSTLPTTDALRRAWDGLSPEFKKIYEDVRKFYADSVNEMVREMKQRAMGLPKEERQAMIRKINEQFGPGKLKQPYFPLRRFGTYWFQVGTGMNKEFYEFESRISRELAMRTRRRQLMNGNKQQQALAGTIAKGNGISELYNRNIGTTQVLKDVQEIIDGVGAADVDELKTELKDSLNQLIYLLLPQQSMRKMFINRKAIQGASADMLRVFATTAVHSAYQQSRFKYAEPFLNNLNNARDYVRQLPIDADTKAVYDDYVKEVEARAKTILSNEDTSMSAKVAGKASEATFYFMLSAPFTSILNVLGFAQITMPYIGGRYGYAKTNAVILKNFGRYFKSMPTRTINPLREGRYMETSFPSIAEGGDLSPLMQRAADRFIEEGQINISLTNDIFDVGERPSDLYTGKYNAVKKAISGLFHQSERLNREVTLLTVFELAYDKFRAEPKKDLRGVVARDAAGDPVKNTDDEAFELAIAEAKDIAGLSLGDFTRQMKPRYFTSPLMSVLTKFKQYPVMATYAIARNFYFTLAAPFRTKEIADFRKQLEKDNLDPKVIDQRIAEAEAQRKQIYEEGRRRLAGILGVTFLLGGIEAQPFFSTLVGPIVKMLGNDDDDDEFFNWENWFRNYMEEELGGYAGSMFEQLGIDKEKAAKLGRKTGEAVGRGVIPAITGGSLADRVSLDPKNLWYREGRYSPDIRESIIENVIANAGPVVGLGFNWVDAYKLMQEGQYQRAFEKAAPAIVSKPVSAARLSEEGAKTRSGVTLVDNFTATEIAMQAIGLQPERLAQAQKAAIEAKEKEQKIEDRRNTIMNRLWLERDNPDGFEVTLEEAGKFSERYPARKIDFSAIRESFQKRAKEAAEAEAFGAKINKRLRPEVEPMLRYGRE
jgi:Large polyvalent protein associated domain 39